MKKLFVFLGALLMVFGLAACGQDRDTIQRIEEAIGYVQFTDMDNVTEGPLDLPNQLRHGVQVSWTSSDPDVIEVVGESGIVYPDRNEDKEVTLTAVYSLDGVERVKEYEFRVRAQIVGPEYTDFGQLFEDDPSGTLVAIGIVTAVFDGGVFIWDGEVHLSVFGNLAVAEIGDEVEVIGELSTWNSLTQISFPDEFNVLSTGHDVDVPVEEISMQAMHELDYDDPTIHGRHYRVTGEIIQSGNFINMQRGEYQLGIYSSSKQSSLDALADRIGDDVIIDVIYYARTSSTLLVLFQGGEDDIEEYVIDDETRAQEAKDALTLQGLANVTDDLTLPTTGLHDAVITWVSSDESVIATDGTVTQSETEDVTVTLTASITVGDVTLEKEFTATVLQEGSRPEGDSVASIRHENWPGVDEEVTLEGVVSAVLSRTSDPGFFLQDADGTAIYVRTDLDVNVGDWIVITGTTDIFDDFNNNRQQLINAELVYVVDTDQPITIIDDMSASDIADAFPGIEGYRYRLTDLELTEINAQFDEFHFQANEDLTFKFYYDVYGQHLANTLEVGDTLEWIEFTFFRLAHGDLLMVAVTLPELEGEALENYVSEKIGLPEDTRQDLNLIEELTLTSFDYNQPIEYTITWESSNESVIATDGTVTRPEFGEGNEEVTLTASVTDGDVTMILEFVIIVLERPDPDASDPIVVYETGFEDSTSKTSYATGNITADGVEWELDNALRNNQSGDKKVGDWSVRGRAEGHAQILEGFSGVTTIEFMYAHSGFSGDGPSGSLSVEISGDGGATWVEVWVTPGLQSTLTLAEIELNYDTIDGIDAGDEIMIRWVFGGASGQRMNIDEIKIHALDE